MKRKMQKKRKRHTIGGNRMKQRQTTDKKTSPVTFIIISLLIIMMMGFWNCSQFFHSSVVVYSRHCTFRKRRSRKRRKKQYSGLTRLHICQRLLEANSECVENFSWCCFLFHYLPLLVLVSNSAVLREKDENDIKSNKNYRLNAFFNVAASQNTVVQRILTKLALLD